MLQRIIQRLILAEAMNIARTREDSAKILPVLQQLRNEVDENT